MNEFGVFHSVLLSTGLRTLVPNKLYFIGVCAREMSTKELFGKPDKED